MVSTRNENEPGFGGLRYDNERRPRPMFGAVQKLCAIGPCAVRMRSGYTRRAEPATTQKPLSIAKLVPSRSTPERWPSLLGQCEPNRDVELALRLDSGTTAD